VNVPDLRHQARELDDAARAVARAHGAARPKTIARALALRAAGGFAVREALYQGHLDPAVPMTAVLRDHVSKRRNMRAQDRINPPEYRHLLDDKEAFARAADERGLPAARTLAIIGGADGGARPDGSPLGGARGWADLLAEDPAEWIVVKPATGGHGRGVRVLRREGERLVEGEATWTVRELHESVARGGRHVVQERVVDHPGLQRINETDALQTVRLTMLLDDTGVHSVATSLKLARRHAKIDNYDGGRTGTMMAMVDPVAGVITSVWRPRPGGAGAVSVDRHPATGAELIGATVPLWSEVRALAERASLAFTPLRTIGWDIGITPQGPLLVEGNSRWDPPPYQSSGEVFRRMARSRPPNG
jgi:hypothetical protein